MKHNISTATCILGLFASPALHAQQNGDAGNEGSPPADSTVTTAEAESKPEATEATATDLMAELKAAADKLAQTGSYTWTTTTETGRGPRTTSGQKGGGDFVKFSMPGRDGETEVILRQGKGVMKGDAGWQAVGGEGGGAGQGRRGFRLRMVSAFQEPTVQAVELVGKVSDVQTTDGGFEAKLTEEAASELLSFRGRGRGPGGGGPQAPAIEGAGGSVTFSVSEGRLTGYKTQLTGKMSFNGQQRDLDRTTTVEFTGLDSTSFDIPSEAVGIFLDMGSE